MGESAVAPPPNRPGNGLGHSALLHAVYGGPRGACTGPPSVHGLGGGPLLGRGRGLQEYLLFLMLLLDLNN